MVVLAGLMWLPRGVLAGLALVLLAGHNLLPVIVPVTPADAGWILLHNGPTMIPLGSGRPALFSAYTLVPWVGVMLAGYLIGPWFTLVLAQRQRYLRRAGGGLLALFVALRFTNWYGDPPPWSAQACGAGYTALSFLNVTKYPPSLLFLCLTLGVALLLLARAEGARSRLSEWLRTFGQVPFFYYLLHLLLISGSALVWTWCALGQPFNLAFASVKDWLAAYEYNLFRAYVVWALVVLAPY